MARLQSIEQDGLVEIMNDRVEVTDLGKSFLRNICMAFDVKLWDNKPNTQLFSMKV
jgi:oxygen-independent coproporphyrinogen-3 oxidase